MWRLAEPDNYNRGKWRFVIFVAGAKAGEHLKIKVAEVGKWFDNAQALSRGSEGKREKEAEPISVEIRCGSHELPRRCNRGTPNFEGLPRIY